MPANKDLVSMKIEDKYAHEMNKDRAAQEFLARVINYDTAIR